MVRNSDKEKEDLTRDEMLIKRLGRVYNTELSYCFIDKLSRFSGKLKLFFDSPC